MKNLKYCAALVLFMGSLVLSLFILAPTAFAFSGAGAGTSLNPYKITSCAQLEEINGNLAASYKVMNFIDCSGSIFTPIGSTFGGFTGTLDGNSNIISGVTAVNLSGSHVGIFSFIEGGSITNLTITNSSAEGQSYVGVLAGGTNGFGSIQNVTITDSNAMGSVLVGGMVGSLFQFSISNSHTSNTTVNGEDASGSTSEIGGLAGEINNAEVSQAYVQGGGVTGNINDPTQSQYIGGFAGADGNLSNVTDSFTTANVTGHNFVGGMSGSVNDTTYARAYATGSVAGDNFVGGFTGRLLTGVIDHSFATGPVTGATIGGMVGSTDAGAPGQIIASVWDVTRSGQADCVGDLQISVSCDGVNVASATPTYFFNNTNPPLNSWDFSTVWRTRSTDYPALQTVPVRPDNVRVVRTATSLQILWDQPPDDGGSPITSYQLQWGLFGGGLADVPSMSASTRSYTLTHLSPSTTYTAQIRAINAHGAGEWLGFFTDTLAAPAVDSSSSSSAAIKPTITTSDTTTSVGDDTTAPPETATSSPSASHAASPQLPPVKDQTDKKGGFDFVWLLTLPGGILLVWFAITMFAKLRR